MTTHDVPVRTIAPTGVSTGLAVSPALLTISATTPSIFLLPTQFDPLLTCPANTTKTACIVTSVAGFSTEVSCGCYPTESTNTPKNLSCQTFTSPKIHGKPIHSRA